MPGVITRDEIINNILTASININNHSNSFSQSSNIYSDSKINNIDINNNDSNNKFLDNSSLIINSVNISDIFMDDSDGMSNTSDTYGSSSINAFINGTFNNQTDTYQVIFIGALIRYSHLKHENSIAISKKVHMSIFNVFIFIEEEMHS